MLIRLDCNEVIFNCFTGSIFYFDFPSPIKDFIFYCIITATKTGLLKAYIHKSGSGYTARLFVNGLSVDQLSCFGEDSSGTVLPWIASGGIDVTLSAFVKQGDVVKIDSDESGSASTNSWYLYATVLQYKS